jgi:hypothetical protein
MRTSQPAGVDHSIDGQGLAVKAGLLDAAPGDPSKRKMGCEMSENLVEKLLVQGEVFETSAGQWSVRVVNDPGPGSVLSPYPDMVLFDLEFKRMDVGDSEARKLRLWASHTRLGSDPGYATLLWQRAIHWLATSTTLAGEIWYLAG